MKIAMTDTKGKHTELKSCPFCGADAMKSSIPGVYFVRCGECQSGNDLSDSEEEAIKFWNTRAKDNNFEALREKLREERKMFEELTPQGSEFFNNPKYVRDYIKDRLDSGHRAKKNLVLQRRSNKALREACKLAHECICTGNEEISDKAIILLEQALANSTVAPVPDGGWQQ